MTASAQAAAQANRLSDLAERYWRFQCDEAPMTAILAGEAVGHDLLLRDAPADHQRRADWAKAALAELDKIAPAGLNKDDRASHALLAREFRSLIEIIAVRAHLRPSIYPLGPDFLFSYWANATALATAEDARRYIARLRSIPAAIDDICACLDAGLAAGIRYPALVVDRAIDMSRNTIALPLDQLAFVRPLKPLTLRGEAYAALAAEAEAAIADDVIPALARYCDFLETRLRPAARQSLAATDDLDGEAYYAFQIEQNTTLREAAEPIHNLGLSEVERLTAEMIETAAAAGFEGDLAGFRRKLTTDNSQIAESAEALREQIEILSKRIDSRIPEFFGRIPRTTYGVTSIPAAISDAMPPAYAQPNAADGSSAGVHWVTSTPAKLPRYMHLPIALHEAWPGHLMHLALMQEMETLPAFRRNGGLRYSACLEGWALYSERLGEDMGLYDTPEKRYGRLEMEMWRAVRLVVDTGLHTKSWSRDQAIDFFRAHMAMPIETITAEVDRYVGMPGQALAYQLGNIRFRAIRAEAEATLGEQFRIRDFHDALMAAGPVTLDVLETLMREWMTAQTAQAA
jgi:uncharacterized protein (DUF885 family)